MPGTDVRSRAMALALAQDFGAEALDLNQRLVAANPVDAGSRTRLARCHLQAGQLDQAEAEYREVLRLDPRSRIAIGGLEMIEQERHRREAPAEVVHVARTPRARRETPAPRHREATPSTVVDTLPTNFSGFSAADFDELRGCERRDAQTRFGPRVVDLIKRVNALQSSIEAAGVREAGKRQLFRASRADVRPHAAHWDVHQTGGRWEPQFNIGMHGGHAGGNWVRIGIGYDLSDDGADAEGRAGITTVRDHFRRFLELLASPRRSLFLGWMVKENGLIQCRSAGPRLDLTDPSKAGAVLAEVDPERAEWVFFGKWLMLENPEDCAVLWDPIALVRTIDRVLLGLMPLWRALWE